MGLRLEDVGTERLTWIDLRAILTHLPTSSAYVRERNGGQPVWTITDYLLAAAVDALQAGNWQRSGKRNAPKPKPVPRPGQAPVGEKYGSDPIPQSEFASWWDNPERE